MQVKELMKRPYVIDSDITLPEVAQIMSSKSIGSLIFVSRNRVRGIITESDMLKNFGKNKKVSQVMSKNVITINPEQEISEALGLMKENKIKRIPVIDDQKKLIGIISMRDIAANVNKLEGEFFFN